MSFINQVYTFLHLLGILLYAYTLKIHNILMKRSYTYKYSRRISKDIVINWEIINVGPNIK